MCEKCDSYFKPLEEVVAPAVKTVPVPRGLLGEVMNALLDEGRVVLANRLASVYFGEDVIL